MVRINAILKNPLYRDYLKRTAYHENERIFCSHDFNHLLTVARLAWQLSLEAGVKHKKDLIYGAGLLHDIGRWQEYEDKSCHALASSVLACSILKVSGYKEDEIKVITQAINEHRKNDDYSFSSSLSYYLQKADKLSRNCLFCEVRSECYKVDKMPNSVDLQS